jgi:uncharacterized protein
VTGELFAPAFTVEIKGTELAADLAKNIVSVAVTSAPSTIDQVTLTLVNAYPELRWTHGKDADLFKEGGSVRVQMGYVDKLQLLFDGEITKLAPTFPASGAPMIRIDALSRLHRLQGSSKLRTFQDVTDKDIVEKIAREAKLGARVDATGVKHRFVYQRNENDLRFLLRRARQLRFELLADGTDLVFRKAQEGKPKSFTLVWGNPQGGLKGSNVLPLRSFQPSLDPTGQPSAVVVRGYDPDTGKPIAERATASDLDSTMAGAETGPKVAERAFGAAKELVITDIPVATADEARHLARSELNRRVRRLVTGSGVSIGIPDLRAGHVVELLGLGRYSGSYYVRTATHTIGADGYATSFAVERSAIG